MSLFRRGDVWWYEFWFAGQRIRESTKSASKTVAGDAEKIANANWRRASTTSRTSAASGSARFGIWRKTSMTLTNFGCPIRRPSPSTPSIT